MKFSLYTRHSPGGALERVLSPIYLVREPLRTFSSMREHRATFPPSRNFHRRARESGRVVKSFRILREIVRIKGIEKELKSCRWRGKKYRPLSPMNRHHIGAYRTNWKLIAGINVASFTMITSCANVTRARIAILLVDDATFNARRILSSGAGHRYY